MKPCLETLDEAKVRQSLEHKGDEVTREVTTEREKNFQNTCGQKEDNFYKSIPKLADEKGSSSNEGNICLFSWAIVGLKGNCGDFLALNRQLVGYFLFNHQI